MKNNVIIYLTLFFIVAWLFNGYPNILFVHFYGIVALSLILVTKYSTEVVMVSIILCSYQFGLEAQETLIPTIYNSGPFFDWFIILVVFTFIKHISLNWTVNRYSYHVIIFIVFYIFVGALNYYKPQDYYFYVLRTSILPWIIIFIVINLKSDGLNFRIIEVATLAKLAFIASNYLLVYLYNENTYGYFDGIYDSFEVLVPLIILISYRSKSKLYVYLLALWLINLMIFPLTTRLVITVFLLIILMIESKNRYLFTVLTMGVFFILLQNIDLYETKLNNILGFLIGDSSYASGFVRYAQFKAIIVESNFFNLLFGKGISGVFEISNEFQAIRLDNSAYNDIILKNNKFPYAHIFGLTLIMKYGIIFFIYLVTILYNFTKKYKLDFVIIFITFISLFTVKLFFMFPLLLFIYDEKLRRF